MKKIFTFLLVIITSLGYSQMSEFEPFKPYRGHYNYIDWPMYSQIWKLEWTGKYVTDKNSPKYGAEILTRPPTEGRINTIKNSYVEENIDEEKVNSYLYESFNEFRKDYKLDPVKENKKLTKQSKEYSKQLTKKYKHSNSQGKYAECIAWFPRMAVNSIKEGENVNKIVAESCFDTFVGSAGHMAILLKEDKKKVAYFDDILDANS